MPEITSSRYLVTAGWSNVPHLDEDTKRELLNSTPPHLRDARTKGIPSLGSGAIYPVAWEEVECRPFAIPAYWPKAYALDVGWNKTAALWGAKDPSDGVLYIYAEHYRGQELPPVHAEAIKVRGAWIKGAIDPAARGRAQRDGEQLMSQYVSLGLKLTPANNAVESGLYEIWKLLSIGRIRFFSTLQNTKAEYRMYRRDERGRVVKEFDHLMDCFVADTPVHTSDGIKRIGDMVGTTGLVRTVGGVFAPYHSCQKYGSDRQVVTLTFSDGSEVTCTPDHRFMSGGKWVQAIDMAGRLCDTAVSNSAGFSKCRSRSSLEPFRNTKASGTTSAASTSNARGCAFTSLFGRMRMAVMSQMGITSITRTTTGPTTSHGTWKRSLKGCISPITSAGMGAAFLAMHLPLRLNGIARRAVRNGIEATMRQPSIFCMNPQISFASIVPSRSRAQRGGMLDFARTTAKPRHGNLLELTTKAAPASGVAHRSLSTGTREPSLVAESAQVRCLAIRDAGRADVYCLTVPSTSAFAVGEAGIIAHNCLRYLVMTWDQIAAVQAPERSRATVNAISDMYAGY